MRKQIDDGSSVFDDLQKSVTTNGGNRPKSAIQPSRGERQLLDRKAAIR
jgi:hypothetical protein